MRRRNPADVCDHEDHVTDYLMRPDGQHEVTKCADCYLIIEDWGVVEPDNVYAAE